MVPGVIMSRDLSTFAARATSPASRAQRDRMGGDRHADRARTWDALNATAQALHEALTQLAEAADEVADSLDRVASSVEAMARDASQRAPRP